MSTLILGGGISGLAAAYFLRKQHAKMQITLLEKSSRLGGSIATENRGGFLFETGPRTFQRSRCPKLLALIEELGLTSDLIFSDPTASKRHLLLGGKLHNITSLWSSLAMAAARDLVMPKGTVEEESIYEFACRRFGKKAAELFFDPMAKGVFGGDMHKLSLRACFPSLHQMEQANRSILLAMKRAPKKPHGLFTLRGGMGQLIEALRKTAIELHSDCPVEAVLPDGIVAAGRKWTADRIISALPGEELAKLCGIPFALRNESLSVVNLGYDEKLPLEGYGYLVPSSEKEELLGQIWDSAVFPGGTHTKLTSMVRSADPEKAALDAMKRHLGVSKAPSYLQVKEAWIPQYDIGHAAKIERFRTQLKAQFPTLELIGNYLKGPSVESCIATAYQTTYN